MVTLIVGLIIIGVVLYLINQIVPMDNNIRIILNAVVIILVLLWVLAAFGFLDHPLPRVRP